MGGMDAGAEDDSGAEQNLKQLCVLREGTADRGWRGAWLNLVLPN